MDKNLNQDSFEDEYKTPVELDESESTFIGSGEALSYLIPDASSDIDPEIFED